MAAGKQAVRIKIQQFGLTHGDSQHMKQGEAGDPDRMSNTGKLPVPLLHVLGDFEFFLLYITTSLAGEAPAEIRERRTGHTKR